MKRSLSCLASLTMLITVIGCNRKPSIKVSTTNVRATLIIETYGEYGTTVRRAVLRDKQAGRVIWEIRAKSGVPQLHRLAFDVGPNNVQLATPQGGDYSVVVPEKGTVFTIDPKTDYELDVWRELNSKPSLAIFRLPG